MPGRLIIEGNTVYEIDEECMERQKERKKNSGSLGGCLVHCQKPDGPKNRRRQD